MLHGLHGNNEVPGTALGSRERIQDTGHNIMRIRRRFLKGKGEYCDGNLEEWHDLSCLTHLAWLSASWLRGFHFGGGRQELVSGCEWGKEGPRTAPPATVPQHIHGMRSAMCTCGAPGEHKLPKRWHWRTPSIPAWVRREKTPAAHLDRPPCSGRLILKHRIVSRHFSSISSDGDPAHLWTICSSALSPTKQRGSSPHSGELSVHPLPFRADPGQAPLPPRLLPPPAALRPPRPSPPQLTPASLGSPSAHRRPGKGCGAARSFPPAIPAQLARSFPPAVPARLAHPIPPVLAPPLPTAAGTRRWATPCAPPRPPCAPPCAPPLPPRRRRRSHPARRGLHRHNIGVRRKCLCGPCRGTEGNGEGGRSWQQAFGGDSLAGEGPRGQPVAHGNGRSRGGAGAGRGQGPRAPWTRRWWWWDPVWPTWSG